MDISDIANPDFLFSALDLDDCPQDAGFDSIRGPGVPQGDNWTNYDDISQFGSEVSPWPITTSAAEADSCFSPQWSDCYANNDESSRQFAQSLPVGPSEGDLAQGWILKQHSTSHHSSRGKAYQRLPRDAVKLLRQWFHQHHEYPYPTHDERQQMEQQTGLDKNQILNWFPNTRRRKRKHNKHRHFQSSDANMTTISLMSPMERWQYSPPETEPAATSDIVRALETTSACPDWSAVYCSDPGPPSRNSFGSSLLFDDSAMSSFGNDSSSLGSFNDSTDHSPVRCFQRPPTPIPSIKPRRWNKKPSFPTRRVDNSTTSGPRPYQCTFCCDYFRNRYDWVRHEKTLHISVDRWCCSPNGGIIQINGVNVCAFCHTRNADNDHLETHNYLQCRDRPPELRVFSRKDHLRQHLRLVHNVEYHASLDNWRASTPAIRSRCGFCTSNFETWEERVDHVAEHFKKGADITQWIGDWGFDPDVELQVENAMPPYLLGIERSTVDPMKSSNVLQVNEEGGAPCSVNPDFPKGMDLYAILHTGLVAYIRDQISTGLYPSDEMIQNKARLLIYGSDDPWNQTFAEVPAWLAALKREAALLQPSNIPFNVS